MKKIITGMIMMSGSPFVIVLGYYTLSIFNLPDTAMYFASFMGGLSVVFNFVVGILLVIKGYQEKETFKGI